VVENPISLEVKTPFGGVMGFVLHDAATIGTTVVGQSWRTNAPEQSTLKGIWS